MNENTNRNDYLSEVQDRNHAIARELRRATAQSAPGTAEPGTDPAAGSAIDYRITGFWRFRSVIVPPNVYAVHTRRGRRDPVHIGLGISFFFDPVRDSFLLVPATVQTLLIDAACICREKQGVSVQAYVQWIVDDIDVAYRRLDFSDRRDPMRLVNLQLCEQAKAAIQDKVATMALEEVLSDRAPIIAELTERLRSVAEGRKEDGPGAGLGLRIVTVQIREAVVRSARLWENLQKPFRIEQDRVARLAGIRAEEEITARELAARSRAEAEALEARERLAELNAEAARRAIREKEETERIRAASEAQLHLENAAREQERVEAAIRILAERRRLDAEEAGTERERLEAELVRDGIRAKAAYEGAERDLALTARRRAIENQVSEGRIREILVEKLPAIAASIPAPHHASTVSVGVGTGAAGYAPLAGLAAAVPALIEAFSGAKGAVQ